MPPGAPAAVEHISTAVAVLSAMITPAVLILASSSLIATTSARLGRILERSRKLGDQLELDIRNGGSADSPSRAYLLDQLRRAVRRARYLQWAMMALYIALGSFVATSFALGVEAARGSAHPNFLVGLGLIGVTFLLSASALLVAESQVAMATVNREMEYIGRLGQPKEEAPKPA